MITLEDIKLDEYMEEVVIHFRYEGERMDFQGTLRISPEEFLYRRLSGDEYLVDYLSEELDEVIH